MSKLTWKRDRPGRQVTVCGRYAVESDGYGYVSEAEREGSGVMAGITGGEWVWIDMSRPRVNNDWSPTMREAKEYAQRHADRA